MTEYMGRYADFVQYSTSRGYIVFGNDIISHGRSITTKSSCLYLSNWNDTVKDMLTTPRRKQRGFLWWHSGSPRTPQGLWRRVLCQSIVTSRPKPSGGRLYWRTHSMFLSTCGRHSQSSLAVYSQAALIPLFMTLIWFSMIYCSSARYIRYMALK